MFKIKLQYLLTSGHGTTGLRDKPLSRSLVSNKTHENADL